MSHPLLEYHPETEALVSGALETSTGDQREALDEGLEIELASELLETTGTAGRVVFLGDLITRTAAAAGQPLAPPVRARLAELLAHRAERVIPVGTSPGKQAGIASAGSRLAHDAGHVLGLELEGLSPEDQEFEVARSFVRYAGDAVRSAGRTATGPAAAATLAWRAAETAAKSRAPGLVHTEPQAGRWIRRGPTLVLLDC
jgi:hypothetical protein